MTSMSELFSLAPQTNPRRAAGINNHASFIFDWDAEEQTGAIIGIISDIKLFDHQRKPIRGSSLIYEELGSIGRQAFLDYEYQANFGTVYALNVSGRYRWEGKYFAIRDYYGEWDCGWDIISLEPADRKTRRAVKSYGNGWDELPNVQQLSTDT